MRKYPDNRCLGKRTSGKGEEAPYVWMTYAQAAKQVEGVASSLAAAGMAPHSRVGVFGANCPEWMIAMQARSTER